MLKVLGRPFDSLVDGMAGESVVSRLATIAVGRPVTARYELGEKPPDEGEFGFHFRKGRKVFSVHWKGPLFPAMRGGSFFVSLALLLENWREVERAFLGIPETCEGLLLMQKAHEIQIVAEHAYGLFSCGRRCGTGAYVEGLLQ